MLFFLCHFFLFFSLTPPPPPTYLFIIHLPLCVPFSLFPPPLCTQVRRPCPTTWPTSEAPRRRRTWRMRKTWRRRRWGTEVVGSTLTVGEAAAKPRPPPPATRHPAKASSPPGSHSMGMVRTGHIFITKTLLLSPHIVLSVLLQYKV